MIDLMVACQEVSREDVELLRHSDALAAGAPAVAEDPSEPCQKALPDSELAAAARPSESAVAELSPGSAASTMEALAWATKMDDHALLVGLAKNLPEAVLEEQLRLYEASQAIVAQPPKVPEKLLVHAHLFSSRMQVGAAFNMYLRDDGWAPGARIPRHACPTFINDRLLCSKATQLRNACRSVLRWHAQWMKDIRLQNHTGKEGGGTRAGSGGSLQLQMGKRRQRERRFQGRPVACPWLRQALFQWFATMRYSIDWNRVRASLRSGGARKSLARFTRRLVRQKARQLLQDYCYQCLMQAQKLVSVKLTARWFRNWEAEYGLSMRKANRKYKVPKAVMAERLEIGWCNCARVRALCLAIHGYDPEMENWDQSPFHNNESGSQGTPTLAVAGGLVPLVEGHADTRARWTANFTTFSNKDRLEKEGPPYCEFVFKAEGEVLQLRLREYIRSRGFGPWLSVATSQKGSYRTPDVLNFLDTHLPRMSDSSRRWRIIFADDFSAHLSPQVFRLCWSRGYVFIPHGGGVTPVVQTPDTDLNQAAKREYTALETAELLAQMRAGVCVPTCRHERCIDMMHEVMSNMALHFQAAEGYLKTGMSVDLDVDGPQDHLIVREAGVFWRELQMRAKINSAVAEVKDEVEAGRLRWTAEDVRRVIRPYPKHKHVDAVLAHMEDDTWVPEGERPYVEDEADTSAFGSDDESEAEAEDHPDKSEAKKHPDEGESEAEFTPDEGESEAKDLPDEPDNGAGCVVSTNEAVAEHVAHSAHLIATFESAISSLQACGAMKSVINLENEIVKERRRIRSMSREDPDVVLALTRQRDEENARERKRLRDVADANARTLTIAKLRK